MKKIIFASIMSCLVVSSVFGITRLTFEQHALRADIHNDMVLTNFQDPGMGGINQVWDFSLLKVTNDFRGLLQTPKYLKNSFFSNQFNTELKEFGNSFYFNINENKIELTGFRSSSGSVEIDYSQPFVKMVYPFEYGDNISGNFSGTIKSGNSLGEIIGTYEVYADGYGKLILPDNSVVENTLRVKTIKKYSQSLSSTNTSEITITTYRWYTQNVRYPLLVFIISEVESNGRTSVTHQAAFKNNISADISTVSGNNIETNVYPNPFSQKLFVSYNIAENSDVKIELYDLTGKLIKVILEESKIAGPYDEPYNIGGLGLKNGMYNIRITINGEQQNHRLMYHQ